MPDSSCEAGFEVEVVYCLAEQQECITLHVQPGCTAAEAVARAGLSDTQVYDPGHLGIFGKLCSPGTRLEPGDRVEIYRPLLLSPTEARRLRARTRAEKPASPG